MKDRLGGRYKRDGEKIYWQRDLLKNVHADRFRFLGSYWATDGSKVFSQGIPLRGADPHSFAVLNHLYAKDQAAVYYLGGTVRGVEANSFEVLDVATYYRSPGAIGLGHAGYARDSRQVVHYHETIGKPTVIRSANRDTFRSLGGVFGIDDARVYVDHRCVQGAHPESWLRLGGLYSRDASSVFYDNTKIENADPESFICLWDDFGIWAKDQNNFYDCGRVASREAYLEQLFEHAKYLHGVAERVASGKL